MFANVQPPASTAASPAPTRSPSGDNKAADGPDSFSRLLNKAEGRAQEQARRRNSAAAANDSHRPAAAGKAPPDGKPAHLRSAHGGAGAPPPAETKTPAAAAPHPEDMPQDGPAGDALDSTDTAQKRDATDPAALLTGLAVWTAPVLPPPGGMASTLGAAGADGAGGKALRGTGAGVTAGRGTSGGAALAAGAATDASTAADSTTSARAQSFANLVSLAQAARADAGTGGEQGQTGGHTDAHAALADTSSPGAITLPAGLLATASSSAPAAAATAEARLSATPGSPEFANQLGVHLTTFVREGVQHARLELHPVELGPVTVQIQLEGGAAQVDMAAQNADTRHALEQALPQLASSLREAGLTLSGGGVFEQPRQPQPDASDSGRPERSGASPAEGSGGSSAPDALSTAPNAPHHRRRGVVDLVA